MCDQAVQVTGGHWWSVYTAGGETVPGLAAAEAVVVRPATRTQPATPTLLHTGQYRHIAVTRLYQLTNLHTQNIHQFNGKMEKDFFYPVFKSSS